MQKEGPAGEANAMQELYIIYPCISHFEHNHNQTINMTVISLNNEIFQAYKNDF